MGEILYYKRIEHKKSNGKTKKKKDESSAPVLYVKLIYSEKTKKILTIFRTKGKDVNPLEYLDKFFNTKMAVIFESIYLGRNIISLQIKAHEVYIKPVKPREPILVIRESDDEDDPGSEEEDKQSEEEED